MQAVADLNAWCQTKTLAAGDTWDSAEWGMDDLKVLHVCSGGKGFVFTTKKILKKLKWAVEKWGKELNVIADGTYKLEYRGWVLLLFGTHDTAFQVRCCTSMFTCHRNQP